MSIRLEMEIKAALEKAAAEERRSQSQMVEKILADWLIERGFLPKP